MARVKTNVNVGGSRVVESKDQKKVSKKVKPKSKSKPVEGKENVN